MTLDQIIAQLTIAQNSAKAGLAALATITLEDVANHGLGNKLSVAFNNLTNVDKAVGAALAQAEAERDAPDGE